MTSSCSVQLRGYIGLASMWLRRDEKGTGKLKSKGTELPAGHCYLSGCIDESQGRCRGATDKTRNVGDIPRSGWRSTCEREGQVEVVT